MLMPEPTFPLYDVRGGSGSAPMVLELAVPNMATPSN